MLEVLYYITEVFKFLCIYVFGFQMQITSNKSRIAGAVVVTISTGILMNFHKTGNLYPFLYFGYIFLVSYLLMIQFGLKKILITIWSFAVIASIDIVSYVLVEMIGKFYRLPNLQMQNLAGSLITLLILFLMFYFILKKNKTALKELSLKYCIVFLVICYINAYIIAIFKEKIGFADLEYALICIALFTSTLIQMVFVLLLSVSNNQYKENARLKEQYLNLQSEHYKYLEEKNMETRKFRHDMRSHLFVIQEYMRLQKWNELNQYLDSICEKLEYVPGYISVQNEIVDAILNYYNKQFIEKKVDFKVKGNMPKNCFIQAYDLCTIFSNILSNALEAAEKTVDKTVELMIRFEEDTLFIREKNPFDGMIRMEEGILLTGKEDKKLHGFGIQNIKDSVKKYQGMVNYEVLKNQYILDIVMENKMPLEEKNAK